MKRSTAKVFADWVLEARSLRDSCQSERVALIFLHAEESNSAATLRIAEAVAGYRRPLAA
ncbi:MAG: hypothetical protein A3G24_14315 [Betaproteobacteria bacterium RIFCSPLOWO2_12_FULL_62_13]|nr:MAG: hypothetical protein A3G24_14315 [Betaproteobacteria bacterium RIFCSPLOWO2_12_FULL_62_13]